MGRVHVISVILTPTCLRTHKDGGKRWEIPAPPIATWKLHGESSANRINDNLIHQGNLIKIANVQTHISLKVNFEFSERIQIDMNNITCYTNILRRTEKHRLLTRQSYIKATSQSSVMEERSFITQVRSIPTRNRQLSCLDAVTPIYTLHTYHSPALLYLRDIVSYDKYDLLMARLAPGSMLYLGHRSGV